MSTSSPVITGTADIAPHLAFVSLAELSVLLDTGDTTATAITEAVLERANELNPTIGAYSDIIPERALADAAASDRRRRGGRRLGPLDGVPVAVKDLIDTTPATCSSGLPHLHGNRPQQDAKIVERLRSAGAVIIGVTQTDAGAFGTSTLSSVNPLSPTHIVGGSSGGAGAVLAAGMAYAAIGTDTGGSIRIPSACCSVCGLKPSWGSSSLDGIRPLAPSLDHVGPMARSVEDLQILHATLSPAEIVPAKPERALVVGLPSAYFADADPLITSAMHDICQRLSHSGMEIRPLAFPSAEWAMAIHRINALREIADYHSVHYPHDWRRYPEISRQTIEAGLSITDVRFEAAKLERAEAKTIVEQALCDVDVLIAPTLPVDIPLREATEIRFADATHSVLETTIRYTALFNQTGHPVVAMPGLILPNGRTVGIQVVGRLHSDAQLLASARLIEQCFALSLDYATSSARQARQTAEIRRLIEQGAIQ